jgi:hypothetical protein
MLLPILFFSCKSDGTVSPSPTTETEALEWSVSDPVNNNIGFVHTIDRNNYFAYEYNGTNMVRVFKVTNNVPSIVSFSDTLYKPSYAGVYDNTYIVFEAYKSTDNSKKFVVYDNGSYSYYDSPTQTGTTPPVVSARGIFYFCRTTIDSAFSYYKFENGVFTEYPVSPVFQGLGFVKSNGSLFLLTLSGSTNNKSFYKITPAGYQFLRTEIDSYTSTQLSNDLLKTDDGTGYISYLNESGAWTQITPSYLDFYNAIIIGDNKSRFAVVTRDTSRNYFASLWDGTTFIIQTNFPTGYRYPEYQFDIAFYNKDNTAYFLLFNTSGVRKIVRARFK